MTYLFRVVVTSLSAAPSGAIGTKVPTNGDIRPYFEASVDGSRRFIRLRGSHGVARCLRIVVRVAARELLNAQQRGRVEIVVSSGFTPMVSLHVLAYVRRMVVECREAQRAL